MIAAPRLNCKGQCPTCHIKPLIYKRAPAHKFCHRCCASFDMETGEQIENWAWKAMEGHFQKRRNEASK